jgi:hypothetical protein
MEELVKATQVSDAFSTETIEEQTASEEIDTPESAERKQDEEETSSTAE